jgi:YD repeat-containing protein
MAKLRMLAGRFGVRSLQTSLTIVVLSVAPASVVALAEGSGGRNPEGIRPLAPYFAGVASGTVEAMPSTNALQRSTGSIIAERRSLSAYQKLSGSQALGVLRAHFGAIANAPAVAPLTSQRGRGWLGYVDRFTALLRRPHADSQLIQSLAGPLWTGRGHHPQPIDMSLSPEGSVLRPRASAVSMSLPRRLAKGTIAVGGVRIGFGGRRDKGAAVGRAPDPQAVLLAGKTFYGNVATDSDLLLRPLINGVDLIVQLRSPSAPEAFTISFGAGRGTQIRADGDGAELVRNGKTMGKVMPPEGSDATGKRVATRYRIAGNHLILVVQHRGRGLTYPLLIDPVYEDWENGSNMWASGNPPDTSLFFTSGSGGAFAFGTSGSFGPGLYAFEQGGQSYGANALGQWYYSAHTRHGPSTYIAEADFYDMIGYYSGDPCHDGILRVGLWHSSPPGWDQAATFPGNSYPNNGGWALHTAEKIDDMASFALQDPSGSACSTWEQAYLGGLFVIEDATSLPAIHFTPPNESVWYGPNRVLTTTASAEDTGLGVQWFDVYGPNGLHEPHPVSGPVHTPCTGPDSDPCPQAASTSYSFNTNNLPDGADQFNIHSTNVLGDASSLPTWTAKVDKTAPVIKASGPLTETLDGRIGNAFYGLQVEAKDGTEGTGSSGVKTIEVLVDGHEAASTSEGCHPGPCTASLSWSMNGQTYGLGEHTVTIVASDVAGNISTKILKVTVVATGDLSWYALQEQSAGEEVVVSVNPAGGNLELATEDIEPEAAASGLFLTRYYNSQGAPSQGATPAWSGLGPHWYWSAGPDVFLRDLGSSVVLHGSSGYLVTLTRQSDGSYTGPPEFEETLTKNTNGTFTLTGEEGEYQFTSAGTMSAFTSSEGEAFKVTSTTVNGQSTLQTLVPTTGKSAELKYTGNHLSEVVAPNGSVSKYAYNAAGQLESYTEPKGRSTTYSYDGSGVLQSIKTATGATVAITTSQGKTTSVLITPKGEPAHGESFAYQAPTAPICNPATDAGETVVTQLPEVAGEMPETYCYNKLGVITNYSGPELPETDDTENTEMPEALPPGTCYESPEFTHEDCLETEEPSENEETESNGLLAPLNVSNLFAGNYGIADNNRTFNTLGNKYFKELHVTKVRRTVRWDIAALPATDPIRIEFETWVTKVKALSKGTGVPLVSFETCPENGSTADPLNPDPENPNNEPIPCKTAPKAPQYAAAVKDFLTNPVFGGVQNFTPWNEPNNGSAEHPTQPTWNKPELAGRYWAMLKKVCAETKHTCQIGAGDFLDTFMKDAFHAPKGSEPESRGYHYFHLYVHGMGDPEAARRWAWHAYTDGELAGLHYSEPSTWWPRFKHFREAINHLPGNPPDIWLSEQGVRFSVKGKFREAGKSSNAAHHIMDAFVRSPTQQLTGLTKQITRFYYYEMRGEAKFQGTVDSGLLCPEKEKGYKCPPSQPRGIYWIYKHKTPSS